MKSDMVSPSIYVQDPRRLPLWRLPAERVAVGVPGDYKPNIALLPDGELVMVAVCSVKRPDGISLKGAIWRSADGGRTWSDRQVCEDLIGHEPYLTCTSKGTLFVTSSLSAHDPANGGVVSVSLLHRSTDGGRSWRRIQAELTDSEQRGFPRDVEDFRTMFSRNLFEMPDGTLSCGISLCSTNLGYLWSSRDDGETWEHGEPVSICDYKNEPYDNFDGFFCEDFTFLAKSGKLLHWIRCGPPSPMYPLNDGRPLPEAGDQSDRTMLCESTDGGRTWTDLRDFGDYGMMYPRVIRLQDGRLLLNYTQRSLYPPLGLRAIFSYDDGETWDFENDQLIIDGKTLTGAAQGGGFGNTLQLADGTLVSCYSYRGADDQTHVEVARWNLPVSSTAPFFFDRALLEMKDRRLTLLHDWSKAGPASEDLCNDVSGQGRIHARIAREATEVAGERFVATLELLSEAEGGHVNTAVRLRDLPVTDWNGYRAVAVRVHNPTDEVESVGLTIKEAGTPGFSCWRMHDVAPGRTETLFLDLAEARTKIGLDDIGMVMIHSCRAPRTLKFLVGQVCLIP